MRHHTFIYFFDDDTIQTSSVRDLEERPQPERMIAFRAWRILHVQPNGRVVVWKDKKGRYQFGDCV